ncbi:hypothetical protein [Microbacterium sp.]|uniref:hypothetical protein n=1 Tax=Microbacterium sp. TaxID=51671 RepID=UPI003A902272
MAQLWNRDIDRADAGVEVAVKRPEFAGDSWPWKRGSVYAESSDNREANDASVFAGGEGRCGPDGTDAASLGDVPPTEFKQTFYAGQTTSGQLMGIK